VRSLNELEPGGAENNGLGHIMHSYVESHATMREDAGDSALWGTGDWE